MKLKYQIKFAIDSMLLQGKRLIGSIALGGFVLLLIAILLFVNEMCSSLRLGLKKTFKNTCMNTGRVLIDDTGDGLTSKLMDLACVEAAGEWSIYCVEEKCLEELTAIQGNNVQEKASLSENVLETIVMDSTAWDMFNLTLYAGDVPDNVVNNQGYILLYLGYEYAGYVDVGTIMKSEIPSEKYMVAGILERGNTIANPDMGAGTINISSVYPLDYAVLEVYHVPYDLNPYFTVADGYDYDEAEKEIMQMGEAYNMSFTIYNMDAVLASAEQSLQPVKEYMYQMILVVGLTVCIVFSCFQSMSILVRKSEYGIMYANGFTTRDLIFIILLENMIKMLISFIIMMPILLIITGGFRVSYGDAYVIQKIVLENISWKLAGISVLLAIISSLVPISIIKKYKPVALIGGNET